MIEYFDAHQYAFWFTLGFGLLVLEALVFGFSSGVVLFTGIGALLTGGLLWGEVLPASWLNGIACFGICSSVSAALLWKPLLKFQNFDVPVKDNSSDMVGHRFRLQQDVSRTRPGSTHYSGVEWRVEIDDEADCEAINAGTRVVVTSVDAGVFRVRSAD
jgi:membrane protein implicated in regulation of membrane protease activity